MRLITLYCFVWFWQVVLHRIVLEKLHPVFQITFWAVRIIPIHRLVLVEYTPEIKIEEIWQESVGVGSDERTLKLVPAVGFGKIIAADNEGLVEARDLRTGKLIWEAETEVHLSARPRSG